MSIPGQARNVAVFQRTAPLLSERRPLFGGASRNKSLSATLRNQTQELETAFSVYFVAGMWFLVIDFRTGQTVLARPRPSLFLLGTGRALEVQTLVLTEAFLVD